MLIGWLTIVENVRFGQDQVMWIAMAGDGVPIREGIHNEWPEARITSYSGHFDAPSGELICFSVRIKTMISAF